MKRFLPGGGLDRYTRRKFKSSSGNGNYSDIEVSGFTETSETLGHLMTSDPYMASALRKVIRQVLKEARKNLSNDAKSYLKSDPRKAARAVKYSVYKSIFGGNVSILQKGANTAGAKWMWIRQKKLRPGQRGGNRILRDSENSRLDQYYGADRGFALRFTSGGTVPRTSRYGFRGSIRQTNWFGHTAPFEIKQAADKVADAINEYVKQQANG